MEELKNILLAKDSDDDVVLIRRALQTAGVKARLQVVDNGQDAVDYLMGLDSYADRTRHPFPKLILLDLQMPRLNGFEVLKVIREKLHLTQLPVIVLTNSDNPDDIKRAYHLGATSYFLRPPDMEGLTEMIRVLQAYWLKFNHFAE
jgi:CheY-like chemotaxis protein